MEALSAVAALTQLFSPLREGGRKSTLSASLLQNEHRNGGDSALLLICKTDTFLQRLFCLLTGHVNMPGPFSSENEKHYIII